MTVLPFTARSVEQQPSRSVSRIAVRVAAGVRYGFYRENDYSAKIPLPAFSIVVRYRETPLQTSQAGDLATETGAYSCCHLSGLFFRGASEDFKNSCGALRHWSLAALQACKQPRGCFLNAFHLLLNVLRHGNNLGRRSFVSVQKDFGEFKNV